MSRLIKSVTIHLCEDGSAEAEVVAKVADLMAFAANDNAALGAAYRVLWRWLRGQDLNL